ncbi:hypothetical protein FQA39_LY01352 [Lamprigera yunnana]|nr:hypothetical protein FQA39_LY01352 [Lamprigera yunnana]
MTRFISEDSYTSSTTLQTCFLNAVFYEDYDKVNDCIAKKVDPNCISKEDGNTPLHIAAENNSLPMVLKLLSIPKINVQIRNLHGQVPLHITVECNNIKMARMLLKKNTNPNIVDRLGNTPLHIAVRSRSISFAQLLIKFHADPNIFNAMDYTPLYIAILETQSYPMMKLLINHGAKIRNTKRRMPLILEAALFCHTMEELQMIMHLVKMGIDITVIERTSQKNILHFVAITGYFQLGIELLIFGADANHRDIMGNTPADVARAHKNFEMMFLFKNAQIMTTII